jgi:hypothetical protein
LQTLGRSALVVLALEAACFNSTGSSPPRDASAPLSFDATGNRDGRVAGDGAASPGDGSPGDGSLVDGDGAVVSQCTKATGPGTMHQSVNASETWTAAGSPHVLMSDSTIYATLTLEPCAEVLLAADRIVTVRGGGAIVAHGTASRRIHFGALDPSKPYGVIRTLGNALDLAYVDIDGGGRPGSTNAYLTGALDLQGSDATLPTQPLLRVDHVTIRGSGSNGVALHDGAGFAPGSAELAISGSAQYPIGMWARAIDGVPTGVYTGNANDAIMLFGQGLNESVLEDATAHERGVPYLVGHATAAGTLYVGGGSGLATLTVEPGVTMAFKKGGVMYVERASGANPAHGALVAAGTAARPVVFTSAEATPAAGSWLGIWFGGIPAATSVITYARVEFAGGASVSGSASCPLPGMPAPNPDAAIRIFGVPASQFVTNTTLANSAGHGIDRGYASDVKQDFLATNTFSGIALCNQSYPSGVTMACPAPAAVPCPK